MLKSIRTGQDYEAFLTLVLIDVLPKENPKISAENIRAQIAKAVSLTAKIRNTFPERRLNALDFRVRLEALRSSGIITAAMQQALNAQLFPQGANATEEDQILPQTGSASDLAFSEFSRQRVSSAFEVLQSNPKLERLLGPTIGRTTLVSPTAPLGQLVSGLHFSDPRLQQAINGVVAGNITTNTVSLADDLVNEASDRLTAGAASLDSVEGNLETVVNGVALSDPPVNVQVPTVVQSAVSSAKTIASTITSDDESALDFTSTVGNALPIPQNAKDTINRAVDFANTIDSTVDTISDVASSISTFSDIAQVGLGFLTTGGLSSLAGGLSSVFGFGGGGNQEVLDAINHVDQDVNNMHKDMTDRFNRVDRELGQLDAKVDKDFDQLHSDVVNGFHASEERFDDLTVSSKVLEESVLEVRDDVNRAEINEFSLFTKADYDTLHNNLFTLLGDIRLADAYHKDIGLGEFRRLADYFTILAKDDANDTPLNGLQTIENRNLSAVPNRLARPDVDYPVNFVMSFPVGGQTLQSRLPGAPGLVDLTQGTDAYANERAWAIAANALAAMVERWPQYAYVINPSAYSAVVSRGADLQSLVNALQSAPASGDVYDALIEAYRNTSKQFSTDLQAALSDEAHTYARNHAFNATDENALVGNIYLAGPRPIPYQLSNLTVSHGCFGESFTYNLTGTALTGWGLSILQTPLALHLITLDACIAHGPFNATRTVRKEVAFYGMQNDHADYPRVCLANSDVVEKSSTVSVNYLLRFPGQPISADTDAIVAESTVDGPEIDTTSTIVGYPRWSGEPTESGHDWNSECLAWRIGDTSVNPDFTNDTYFRDVLQEGTLGNLSPSFGTIDIEDFAKADGSQAVSRATTMANQQIDTIYAAFNNDLVTALSGAAGNSAGITATNIAAITSDLKNMEAYRDLLRAVVNIGFYKTALDDDLLHSQLYGSDALPGPTEIIAYAQSERQKDAVRDFGDDIAQVPLTRLDALHDRLTLARLHLVNGDFTDSHELVDLTVSRLKHDACHVPGVNAGGTRTC